MGWKQLNEQKQNPSMSIGYIHAVAALAKQRRQSLSFTIRKEKASDEQQSLKITVWQLQEII